MPSHWHDDAKCRLKYKPSSCQAQGINMEQLAPAHSVTHGGVRVHNKAELSWGGHTLAGGNVGGHCLGRVAIWGRNRKELEAFKVPVTKTSAGAIITSGHTRKKYRANNLQIEGHWRAGRKSASKYVSAPYGDRTQSKTVPAWSCLGTSRGRTPSWWYLHHGVVARASRGNQLTSS